jgi:hypothetical protein
MHLPKKEPTVGRRKRLTSGIAAVFGVATVILFSTANAAAMGITVKNTSAREIRGLYLSATAQSAWGPDLLDGGIIAPSDVWTVSGVSCQGVSVLVAEDDGGCFLYQSVGCAADASWTITGNTPRDCGR